jgi:glycosyltransferase involved in cell wall biosynthesis
MLEMIGMPKVSVIIAAHNKAGSISRAVDSVLAQSFQDFELMIIDDGSEDNTAEVMNRYSQVARYFYQQQRGIAAAFNIGIKHAHGEYMTFLYPDDVLLNGSLQRATDILKKYPDVSFAYGQGLYVDNIGRVVRVKRSTLSQYSGIVDGKELIREMLFVFRLEINGLMVHRRCLEETGGFDENLMYGYELPLLVRLAKKHNVAYIAEPLSRRPFYPGGTSRTTSPKQAEQTFLTLLREVFEDQELRYYLGSLMSKAFCANYRRIASYSYRKDMRMTRLYLRKAFVAQPTYFLKMGGFSNSYLYAKSFLPISLVATLRILKNGFFRRFAETREVSG